MLTCAEACDALLEADLAELRDRAATPLAAHLATCVDCRGLADRVLVTTDALSRARVGRPRRAVAEAAAAARMEADRIRRTRRRWLAAIPTLAAAGIAVILLAKSHGGSPSAAPAAAAASPAAVDLPLVVGAARTVAVFQTANPNIVVVWQFPD